MAYGMHGLLERPSDLFRRHAAEIVHLDEARERGVFSGKRLESAVELDEIEQFHAVRGPHLEARVAGPVTGGNGCAFGCGSSASVVDQNLPHDTRGYGEEVDLIVELAFRAPRHLEVRFVHECGRLQSVTVPFAAQMARSDPV